AILCADVVGYSRLMGDDEEATIETLTAYRKVFTSKIKKHRGRVVDAKGDAILAEFASVVDAVKGAVEIQQELAGKNTELPDGRRMDFRIGINLGDVVVKDDVIYGEGVNVAARLESLAESGGVCISRPVYDQVNSKIDLGFDYLGEQQVKNIAEPVRAYRVNLAKADVDKQIEQPQPDSAQSLMPVGVSLEMPDEPSIAVLPFTNISADPEQEYFSDGLTEDITTDLSLLPGLFVIARNSTFTYKGKAVTTQQVGKELGVRYVLEGSVRKSSDRVRVTAQLIEAASGNHLWAKRYDRGLEDAFSLQDELTKEIVTALDVELVLGEMGKHYRDRFTKPEAGEALYRGMAQFYKFDEPSHALARKYFEQIMELEPHSILGYIWQAQLCVREVFLGWSEDRDKSIKNMGELLEKALKIDDRDPLALGYAATHQLFLGKHDQSITYAKQAVVEGPGMDGPYNTLGWVQMFNESPLEGIENLKRGMRLSPTVTAPRSSILGTAYRNAGQLELAAATLETTVKRFPAFISGRVALASCYSLMGKDQDAKQEVAEILRRDPTYTIARYTSPNFYRNKKTMKKWADSLRKAGLPE
ncbi:MAG: hypothetical protein O7E56_03830, partial [SAR324 cluster bacterium]|nr:hypothetical protein [SAR324 cluster bacterium]